MDVLALLLTLVQHQRVQLLLGNLWHGLWLAVAVFCLIYTIERFTGECTSQYRRRNFRHDLCFWFYYHSGVHDFLLSFLLFSFLEQQLAFLRLPLDGLPLVVRYVIYWVVVDFIGYWGHRLMHANRYLWALHLTHHSQDTLTFPTGIRVHPFENVIVFGIKFLPFMLLGTQPKIWLAADFVLRMVPDAFQHTEIAWRMGPLYRMFVSPSFHSFHHSINPEHYNKNFGISLSIWDFCFSTGVDEPKRARMYGIAGVALLTLRSQLCEPLHIIYHLCGDAQATAVEVAHRLNLSKGT